MMSGLLRASAVLAALMLLLAAFALAALCWSQERLLFLPQTLHLRLPAPRGVLFFPHDNAGNLQGWFVNADFHRRANIDLFMLDYRGYGKCTGRMSSETQLPADVPAAWDAVAPPYEGKKRVIYGRSLCSGQAATLSADVSNELTVRVSPYVSMLAPAADHYPLVPAWVLRYRLRTDLALPGATLLLVPEAGHNDL
jgi:uncharacterized protein